MCGIFGLVIKNEDSSSIKNSGEILKDLALFSESRGKDSSGFAFKDWSKNRLHVIKGDIPISDLINKKAVRHEIENISNVSNNANTSLAFGHSRLVTNGTQLNEHNNQPVIKDGIIGVHNGIIANVDKLWKQHLELKRDYEIDTEVFLALIRANLNKGISTIEAFTQSIREIYGTVATALVFNDRNELLLGTNNGSLYYITDNKTFLCFASERFILEKINSKYQISKKYSDISINQVYSNSGLLIRFSNMDIDHFDIYPSVKKQYPESKILEVLINVEKSTILNETDDKSVIVDIDQYTSEVYSTSKSKILEYNIEQIKELKRCKKCVLPSTFPFIEFDSEGVCNYCNNYVPKNNPKSLEELLDLVEPYRKKDSQTDCLVPFSGGRDSTYVLHFVKKELNLNPITFTYDWGMVTDLARRNIARVCGKLGVENIIVAADIKKKRKYIRENITAWLKRPSLGMIPLFMAGDKYFFKYANEVKHQNDIDLQIWGINFLENTDFKVGFAGVPPDWQKKMIYSMNLKRQANLFKYVFSNLLFNPSYVNSSIVDTLGSFTSRYFNPRKDYYHFFDFHEWDEEKIEEVLFDEYDWEIAKDLNSTWRIGDGTASFYNYIYYTVAGFSEFDTFRSNQIREGMITREQALDSIFEENRPRYSSLRWYLEIVGLDFESVIKKINSIPKLY